MNEALINPIDAPPPIEAPVEMPEPPLAMNQAEFLHHQSMYQAMMVMQGHSPIPQAPPPVAAPPPPPLPQTPTPVAPPPQVTPLPVTPPVVPSVAMSPYPMVGEPVPPMMIAPPLPPAQGMMAQGQTTFMQDLQANVIPAAYIGGQAMMAQGAHIQTAMGRLFGTADYVPEEETFSEAVAAMAGLRRPRNVTQAEFQHMAAQDVATRMTLGTMGGLLDVGIPTLAAGAFSTLMTGGLGLGLGLGAAFLPGMLGISGEMVQEHFARRQAIEDLSRSFITGAVSRNPLGRGFTREEASDITNFIEDTRIADTFFDRDEFDEILAKGMDTGLFSAVRSTDDFKTQFKDLRENLRLVMQTMGQSIEEGIETLSELRRYGINRPSDVQTFLVEARSAAAMSGVNPDVAAQMGTMSGEGFRGTGISMAMGARMGLQSLEIAGTMMAQGRMDSEVVRQLGGATGVARSITQMQQGMLLHDRSIQQALLSSSRGSIINLEDLTDAFTGQRSRMDISQASVQRALEGGIAGIYQNLARKPEMLSNMPEELAPLAAVYPFRQRALQFARANPSVDPDNPELLKGLMMAQGIDHNRAEAMVSSYLNMFDPAMMRQRERQARLMMMPERESIWQPVREFWGGIYRPIERGITGFAEDIERDIGDALHRMQGGIIYEGVGEGLSATARQWASDRTPSATSIRDTGADVWLRRRDITGENLEDVRRLLTEDLPEIPEEDSGVPDFLRRQIVQRHTRQQALQVLSNPESTPQEVQQAATDLRGLDRSLLQNPVARGLANNPVALREQTALPDILGGEQDISEDEVNQVRARLQEQTPSATSARQLYEMYAHHGRLFNWSIGTTDPRESINAMVSRGDLPADFAALLQAEGEGGHQGVMQLDEDSAVRRLYVKTRAEMEARGIDPATMDVSAYLLQDAQTRIEEQNRVALSEGVVLRPQDVTVPMVQAARDAFRAAGDVGNDFLGALGRGEEISDEMLQELQQNFAIRQSPIAQQFLRNRDDFGTDFTSFLTLYRPNPQQQGDATKAVRNALRKREGELEQLAIDVGGMVDEKTGKGWLEQDLKQAEKMQRLRKEAEARGIRFTPAEERETYRKTYGEDLEAQNVLDTQHSTTLHALGQQDSGEAFRSLIRERQIGDSPSLMVPYGAALVGGDLESALKDHPGLQSDIISFITAKEGTPAHTEALRALNIGLRRALGEDAGDALGTIKSWRGDETFMARLPTIIEGMKSETEHAWMLPTSALSQAQRDAWSLLRSPDGRSWSPEDVAGLQQILPDRLDKRLKEEILPLFEDGMIDKEERQQIDAFRDETWGFMASYNEGATARRQGGTAEMLAGYATVADQLVNAANILAAVADKLKADNDNFALHANMGPGQSGFQGVPYRQ